jgi:hypothetical protein
MIIVTVCPTKYEMLHYASAVRGSGTCFVLSDYPQGMISKSVKVLTSFLECSTIATDILLCKQNLLTVLIFSIFAAVGCMVLWSDLLSCTR